MTDTQQVETIEKPPKRGGSYKYANERLTAVAALIEAGMSTKEAAEHIGYSKDYAKHLTRRIKEKGIAEYVTEKRLKSAKHVIDTFMQGKPIGRKTEIKEIDGVRETVILEPGILPKDSTIKDCAMSVIDRAHPKQIEAQASNISFTQVNLNVVAAQQPGADTITVQPITD